MGSKFLWKETRRLLSIYYMELRGFYWRLPFNKSKIFSLKIFPGVKIRYQRKGDIGELLYKYEFLVGRRKSFEYGTLELFTSLIKPGDVIIDIGANTGMYSIFFSKSVGKTGSVLAFEPDRETFNILQQNLKLNNTENVIAFNLALSDKEANIEMVSEATNDAHLKTGDAFRYIKVLNDETNDPSNAMKAVRLDDLEEVQQAGKINLMKVDVEGAELLVFKGARQTLEKFKPTIIFELNGKLSGRFNYKPIDVLLLLHEMGYSLEEFDAQQWIARPVSPASHALLSD